MKKRSVTLKYMKSGKQKRGKLLDKKINETKKVEVNRHD